MKNGKLESESLKDLLTNYTGAQRDDVLLSGKLGLDCAYFEAGDKVIVLSTDPVTAATKNLGSIAFDINLNDISTSGAQAVGIMVTILLPQGSSYEDVKEIMGEIHRKSEENNIAILGGHTEITDAVKRTIVSITIVGHGEKGSLVNSERMEVGDYLVVSKKLAIEGTYLIYNEFPEELESILTEEEKGQVEHFGKLMSVVKEGKAGREAKVHMMHDITEGGVLGAVHEVCEGNKLGCIIYEENLPFFEVTKKITDKLKVDPYRLISSGSMLFATSDPEKLIRELNSLGIEGAIIGKVTKSGFRMKGFDDIERKIEPPKRDEIYRLFE